MDGNRKVKKLIFLEVHNSNIKRSINDKFINAGKLDTKNYLFIATTPNVHAHLIKQGLPVENTLPYFTNESHEHLLKKSRVLIDWLRQEARFLKFISGINISARERFIFLVRDVIQYHLRAIEIISNAINKHDPDIIAAFENTERNLFSPFINAEEGFFAKVTKITADRKSLIFEDITSARCNDYRLPKILLLIIKSFLKYGKFKIQEKLIIAENIFDKRKLVILTTKHYNMLTLAERIHKELPGCRCLILDGPVIFSSYLPELLIRLFGMRYADVIIRQRKLLESLVLKIRNKRELFSYRDIAFGELVCNKIEKNITDYIIGLLLWTIGLSKFIQIVNPSLILSNGNRTDDVILAELSKNENREHILISHGSHVAPKNEYENIEFAEHGTMFLRGSFPSIALQTPVSEGYLREYPTDHSIIKTGPLIWGMPVDINKSKLLFEQKINKKFVFNRTKVVLHASSSKLYQRLYVYETRDEYIKSLVDLVKVVENIPDTILIVRFRPTNSISTEALKTFVSFSEKVILSVDEPFIDVLGMADLLVSFSSTTIEEALQNKIPVLLYGGDGRYVHIPSEEISLGKSFNASAVYHMARKECLEFAIRRILDLNTKGNNGLLFSRYIYSSEERIPLVDLVNSIK